MNLSKKYFLIVMILVFLCSYKTLQNNTKTGFSEICLNLSERFKTTDEHGLILNDRAKKFLSTQEFSKILSLISKYDLDGKLEYKMERNKTDKIEKCVWKPLYKKDNIISVEKLIFAAEIEYDDFNSKKRKSIFTIVDYLIVRKTYPKKIYLRLAENEIEKLSVDKTDYLPYFESRILGIDEAEDEFDRLLYKK